MRRVIIVGGGTSGWLSAAYLTSLFGPGTAERLQVTLVEAEDLGIIGVGEATIPSMRTTLRKIAVPEAEFLGRCNGSFKLGIKFRNWHRSPAEAPEDTFWNPFGILPFAWDVPVAAYWLRARRGGQQGLTSFANDFSIHPALAEAYRAPKGPGTPDYDRIAAYAYHLDTVMFGRYLREIAIGRGVTRIVDKVVGVVRDERGFIELIDDRAGLAAYKHVAALRRKALAELPDNYSYLKSLHEGEGALGKMDLQGASFSLG